MPWVDVLPLLTDPSDAATTTLEIDDIGADLVRLGGGTLFFAASEYLLTSLADIDVDPGDPLLGRLNPSWQIPDLALGQAFQAYNRFGQGGIRVRPGISLLGEQGTVLKWAGQNNGALIGADFPFEYGTVEGNIEFVEGIIQTDVVAGQYSFAVDQVENFAEGKQFNPGDTVVIRLDLNPNDPPEVKWWTFARVDAVDYTNKILTLDRPAQVPMKKNDQQSAYGESEIDWPISKLIRKVSRLVDGISIKGFDLRLNTEPEIKPPSVEEPLGRIEGGVQSGISLSYVRNVTVEDIVARDPGAGIVTFVYAENCRARHLHVTRSHMFGYQHDDETTTPNDDERDIQFGRGFSVAGGHGVTFEDVRLENFQTTAILVEAASTQVLMRNLYFINSNERRLDSLNADIRNLIGVIGGSECRIDGLTVEGYGWFGLSTKGTESERDNPIVFNDLDMRTVPRPGAAVTFSGEPLAIDMRSTTGRVRIDKVKSGDASTVFRQRFAWPRIWAKAVLIKPDATTQVALPDGLIRRGRLFLSSVTGDIPAGLSNVDWPTTSGTSYNLVGGTPPTVPHDLRANETIELPKTLAIAGAFGAAEQQINSGGVPQLRILEIVADDTVLANNYLGVHLEYFPLEDLAAPPPNVQLPGSRDDRDRAWVQDPDQFTYPWVVRRDEKVVGNTSDIDLVTDDWTDVFSGGADLTVPAFEGQVLALGINLRVSDTSTGVSFDVKAEESGASRWAGGPRGYAGWRAVGPDEQMIAGTVTHIVTDDDLDTDDHVVRLKLKYRADSSSSTRKLKVSGDDQAVLDVINLGFVVDG